LCALENANDVRARRSSTKIIEGKNGKTRQSAIARKLTRERHPKKKREKTHPHTPKGEHGKTAQKKVAKRPDKKPSLSRKGRL